MTNHKYNEEAYLSKTLITHDGEQTRSELKRIAFRCYESELKQSNQFSPMGKVLANISSISIVTDDDCIGKVVESDNTIEFREVEYSVVMVQNIRSMKHPNDREYLITMQLGG